MMDGRRQIPLFENPTRLPRRRRSFPPSFLSVQRAMLEMLADGGTPCFGGGARDAAGLRGAERRRT